MRLVRWYVGKWGGGYRGGGELSPEILC